MLVKALRNGLGQIIIFADWVTRPKKKQRSAAEQQQVDQAVQGFQLYQFHACPFCVKVRRKMHELNVSIELKDAKNDPLARAELEQQGGKIQVPCLKMLDSATGEVTWLYESKAIVEFLENRFA
ncbi:glutaredoxin [Thiopseudomonas alkaliphila]|uniref:Glutaredoxin n=1 Tax=Thiopseudomonas alkaliphila TaxID=1697053 RepID=A0A0K1XD12_9GAMM|nr:glutaredoxin domain-containing protein [Thiopseudomonas alkaliphila]AKX44800.1 glutaredoxin [Thiopseudomonas alkaliphila]AKX47293.1 glutaredoxin [Thiopseudomonas alkaliphila]AKX47616.1 glutaredoxin [Thiopseudomonas alkaliphila]AKX48170.1 glutaredoxin [Thiopseudomonas alkaliphila]AKX51471.1 glutaredoxin [Thiopseudomonas alkaliphila]